jgi:hypothetical protein
LLDDYLSLAQTMGPASALSILLDNIVSKLPQVVKPASALDKIIKQHAEWQTPILLLIVSIFTLLPLLVSCVFGSGAGAFGGEAKARSFPPAKVLAVALFSAALFSIALGFAARVFWDSAHIGYQAAALAFPLPLLWSLYVCNYSLLGRFARFGFLAGSLGLFAYIFSTLTIVGTALMYVEHVEELWIAPLFGTLFASAILAFILEAPLNQWLFKFTGYYMFFIVALGVAYVALRGVLKDPTSTAITVAAVFTLLTAIGILLDEREEKARGNKAKAKRRWAWMFSTAAVLFLLPFMLVAFAHAVLGDSFSTHFALFMADDGTFSEFVWWLSGALGGSALLIGLGGRFGGGGASGFGST